MRGSRYAWLVAVAAAVVLGGGGAHAQPAPWHFTVSLGGFVRGNRAAVANWLTRNGYGVTEPQHCGFGVLLNPICKAPEGYPRMEGSDPIGWTVEIRRTITDRFAVSVLGATEQSGTATGRCDDQATPRDVRCTNRFMELEFSGASVASLAILSTRGFHLGAGPAMLFENWRLQPAHLAGVWLDAVYGGETKPWFLRAQYRFYRSASLRPEERFTGFHPSTVLIGMGFAIRLDDSGGMMDRLSR